MDGSHLRNAESSLSCYSIVVKDNEIKGFIICFREKSSYDSPNYKFFSNTESKFLYIDRIAIKDSFRRQGIGKSFYEHIEKIAITKEIPLCCEVNTLPKNLISIKFHESFGFKKIGNIEYEDHSVAFFRK